MITFIVDGSDKEVMEDIFFSRYFTLDLKGAEGLVYLIFLRGTFAIQAGENEYVVTNHLLPPPHVLPALQFFPSNLSICAPL